MSSLNKVVKSLIIGPVSSSPSRCISPLVKDSLCRSVGSYHGRLFSCEIKCIANWALCVQSTARVRPRLKSQSLMDGDWKSIDSVFFVARRKKPVPICDRRCYRFIYFASLCDLCGFALKILSFHYGFWDESEEKTATNDRRHVLRPCWILKVRAKIYLSAFA